MAKYTVFVKTLDQSYLLLGDNFPTKKSALKQGVTYIKKHTTIWEEFDELVVSRKVFTTDVARMLRKDKSNG